MFLRIGKNAGNIFFLFLCFCVLTACPYKSPVSSGPPVKAMMDISGNWKGNGTDNIYLKISKITESEMLIIGGETPKPDVVLFVGRAFYSAIGSSSVLNIQYLGDEKGFQGLDRRTFYYAKIRKTSQGFCYRLVDDKLLKDKSLNSLELNRMLTENWNDPDLFDDKESCMIQSG